LSFEEFKKALETLNITGTASLKEVKKTYREKVKNAQEQELKELSKAYKIVVDFMESYPFSFSEDEFFRAYPEERLKRRIWQDPLWGRE